MRSFALLIPIFACAALGALWLADRAAMRIESEVVARAEIAIDAVGASWASASADGAIVTLGGEAPSASARFAALAAVRGATPEADLVDQTSANPPPETLRPPLRLTLMRGLGDVTIQGSLPDAATRAYVIEALRREAPRVSFDDFSETNAAPPAPKDFAAVAAASARIVNSMLHGRVEITKDVVAAYGLARSEDAVSEIDKALDGLAALGLKATRDITPPPRAVREFLLHAEVGAAGSALITCAATDQAEAEMIRGHARRLFGGEPPDCRVGPGAPNGAWGAASITALDAVSRLPRGEIRLLGVRARLTAAAPTRSRELQTARAMLADELPDGYRVAAIADFAPTVTPGEVAIAAVASGAFSFERRADRVLLRGEAPSDILARGLVAYIHAVAPGVAVQDEMKRKPGVDADAWRRSAMAVVDVLAGVDVGFARVDDKSVELNAEALRRADVGRLHRLLVERLGGKLDVNTRFSIEPSGVAAAQPLPPGVCAKEMAMIVKDAPILFEPGSSRIDAASAPTIASLAAVVTRCEGGRIVIAGHTDSQGSARANRGLSRARAEAVMAALLEAGVSARRVSAKGYGEARPIADNGTEEGRALNRRIEFIAPEDAG